MFADQLLKWKGKFVSEGQGCKGWEPFLASSESSLVSLELKKKKVLKCSPPHQSHLTKTWLRPEI